MSTSEVQNIINRATITAAGGPADVAGDGGSGADFVGWMVHTGDLVPPWWSRARDRKLSDMWKESNHLSLAVYNTQAKIVGIPPRIVAKNPSIAEHVADAEALESRLFLSADFARGWEIMYAKFIESLITQDNGAFMEIIGDGSPTGPIIGAPLSLRHLDSAKCTRTGDPEYPLVYTDDRGIRYKMHWTRVIMSSQMPSSIKKMNGVGFCAVSRSIEIAQTLNDIVRYKQERLGSRPHSQMIVGKGITGKQIMLAFRGMEEDLSNRGFTKYGRTVAIGSENPNIGIEKIDLNHMDPFDEEVSMNLGMFAISAAFGMDAEEIWPVGGKSSGKAEANIRRMRSRGRLPAQITNDLAAQFNFKVIPQHLRLEFDFRDDEEDMQRANIKDIRGRNRERDLGTGAINVRTARIKMAADGDLSREGFLNMELSDGRLMDGKSISVLFYSKDPVHSRLLNFMDNPLSIIDNVADIDEELKMSTINDASLDVVLSKIQRQRAVVLDEWQNTQSASKEKRIEECFFALEWLENKYNFAAGRLLPPVPMQARRQRTDIRVAPVEVSPPPGDQSPADAAQVQDESMVTT
jgi:hypothetical protein